MNDISIVFGQRMLAVRGAKGLSFKSATELLQISKESLSDYEAGKYTPKIKTIIGIAKAYEVTTDYLLGVADENGRLDVTAESVCEYTGLSPEAVEGLHKTRKYKTRWL